LCELRLASCNFDVFIANLHIHLQYSLHFWQIEAVVEYTLDGGFLLAYGVQTSSKIPLCILSVKVITERMQSTLPRIEVVGTPVIILLRPLRHILISTPVVAAAAAAAARVWLYMDMLWYGFQYYKNEPRPKKTERFPKRGPLEYCFAKGWSLLSQDLYLCRRRHRNCYGNDIARYL